MIDYFKSGAGLVDIFCLLIPKSGKNSHIQERRASGKRMIFKAYKRISEFLNETIGLMLLNTQKRKHSVSDFFQNLILVKHSHPLPLPTFSCSLLFGIVIENT